LGAGALFVRWKVVLDEKGGQWEIGGLKKQNPRPEPGVLVEGGGCRRGWGLMA